MFPNIRHRPTLPPAVETQQAASVLRATVPQGNSVQDSLNSLHTDPMHQNVVSHHCAGTAEPSFKLNNVRSCGHHQENTRRDDCGRCQFGIRLPSNQAIGAPAPLYGDLFGSSGLNATRKRVQVTTVNTQEQGGHCHPTHMTPTVKSTFTFPHRVTSNSNQGLHFTAGTMKRDVSFVRKLRQRERNYQGNWRFAEQIRGKRSQEYMDDDSDGMPPCKQFINEEKMAARMGNLSITNDCLATLQERWSRAKQTAKRRMEEIESRLSDSESDGETNLSANRQEGSQQLEVSPELKAALSRQEEVIPQSIVQSMFNPCTQLVLWKPPTVHLALALNPSSDQKETSQVKADAQLSTSNLNPASKSVEMDARPTQAMPGVVGINRLIGAQGDTTDLFDCIDDTMDI